MSIKYLSTLLLAVMAMKALMTVTALPTGASYGKVARRSNYSSRRLGPSFTPNKNRPSASLRWAQVSGSRQWKGAKATDAPAGKPLKQWKGGKPAAAGPTSHHPYLHPTSVAYVAAVTTVEAQPMATGEPSTTMSAYEYEASAVSEPMQAANGVEIVGQESSPEAWVPASGINLPGSGLSVRSRLYGNSEPALPEQRYVKREVAHIGEPLTLTLKINAVGDGHATASGSIGLKSFTLLNATKTSTATRTPAVITPTNTNSLAHTSIAVNIIQNNISSITASIASASAASFTPLPTVTQTLTFTVGPSQTQTATVTLVPTATSGSVSYVPANYNSTSIELIVNVNATIEIDGSDSNSTSDDNNDATIVLDASTKRDLTQINLLEAAAASRSLLVGRDEMLSERWEDCEVEHDTDCLPLPELDQP